MYEEKGDGRRKVGQGLVVLYILLIMKTNKKVHYSSDSLFRYQSVHTENDVSFYKQILDLLMVIQTEQKEKS